MKEALQRIEEILLETIPSLSLPEKVEFINEVRKDIHDLSPFKDNPIDYVKWEINDNVVANDYNPNKVAPPEMELLEVSIMNDGYTQPIVTWYNDDKEKTEVIDGFHRNRVGKESVVVRERVKGYLPVVDIRKEQSGKNDRIASTIRHNRARGKHQVDAMSEIVIELKNRNWTNSRISKQLGMDEEEVLRLCQISGLEHLFLDSDFSRAWESSDVETDFEPVTDDLTEETLASYKIPNEGDENRIYHTYDKWECHEAGFYLPTKKGITKSEGEEIYRDFLRNSPRFEEAANYVIDEWVNSCEHYLSNRAMNRIAWMGQAAACLETGLPSSYCGGFNLLTPEEQEEANQVALDVINKWMTRNGREELTMEEALSSGRQTQLY